MKLLLNKPHCYKRFSLIWYKKGKPSHNSKYVENNMSSKDWKIF